MARLEVFYFTLLSFQHAFGWNPELGIPLTWIPSKNPTE
jgi:hypothetical protein